MKSLNLKCKTTITTLLAVAFYANLFGQTTPDELGRKVFTSFQKKDLTMLDTLIPTAAQIVTISEEKGLNTSDVKLRKNFDEVYQHHLQKFKDKCVKFINDTTYFKVDWSSSIFKESIVTEKEISLTLDSLQNSKRVNVHTLDIHFSDKKQSFVISFNDIYNYRGLWKIGDNVKFKRNDDE